MVEPRMSRKGHNWHTPAVRGNWLSQSLDVLKLTSLIWLVGLLALAYVYFQASATDLACRQQRQLLQLTQINEDLSNLQLQSTVEYSPHDVLQLARKHGYTPAAKVLQVEVARSLLGPSATRQWTGYALESGSEAENMP